MANPSPLAFLKEQQEQLNAQANEPFDPVGELTRNLESMYKTVSGIPSNVKRFVQDPVAYAKSLPSPTPEQLMGMFSPSHIGGIGMAGVIKPKGGNYFKGEVEKNLSGLKSDTMMGAPNDMVENVLKKKEALNNWVDKNLTNYVKNQMGTPEDPVRLAIDSRVAEAKAKHKEDMDRANKFAQRAKEEADPRRQANFEREAIRLTVEANNNLELGVKHASHLPYEPDDFNIGDIKAIKKIRQKEGFPAEGMGKSDQAKAYEMNVDNAFYPKKAGQIQELPEKAVQRELAKKEAEQAVIDLNAKFTKHLESNLTGVTDQQIQTLVDKLPFTQKEQMVGDDSVSKAYQKLHNLHSPLDEYNLKRLEENPYINKLSPDTNIYSAQTGGLGFDHVLDVLKENLANGRLKPEELKNISVEQAVRKTADYDLDLAKKMQDAQAKKLEDMTVHKEYPNGMKWVQLDKPGQFAAESQAMGHSVKGYEPPEGNPDWIPESGDEGSDYYGHGGWEGIRSGEAKVYSLVDPKGNPHTTIEVKANQNPYPVSGEAFAMLPRATKAQYGQYVREWRQRNPDIENLTDEHTTQALKEAGVPPQPDSITQIKGKSNRAPNENYLPYVQDFVKSGNWSDVGDIKNTGLIEHSGKYFTEPELIEAVKKHGRMGVQDVPWDVARQRHIDAGVPEDEALANWVEAFKEGRGRLDIPPVPTPEPIPEVPPNASPVPPVQNYKAGGAVRRYADGGEVSSDVDLSKPFFGNPNIQRQGALALANAAERSPLTLPDPKTYAAATTALSVPVNTANMITGALTGLAQSIPESIRTGRPPGTLNNELANQYFQKHAGMQPDTPLAAEYQEKLADLFDFIHAPPVAGDLTFAHKVGESMNPIKMLTKDYMKANPPSVGLATKALDSIAEAIKPEDQIQVKPKRTRKAKAEEVPAVDIEAHPEQQAYQEQAGQLKNDLQAAGQNVKDVSHIDELINHADIPELTMQDLVGMNIYPTIADRTAAAALFKGVDSSELEAAIPLLGGPNFPLRKSNVQAGVGWADRGKGVISQKESKAESGADHMMVVLGDADMHKSNTTVNNAFFSTLEAYAKDKRIPPENAELLNNLVKESQTKDPKIAEHIGNFPGVEDPKKLDDYLQSISFEARARLMDILSSKKAQELGVPSFQRILDETREKSMAGNRWGDGALILKMEDNSPMIKLGEEGTQPHFDFPYGKRGKIVGRLKTPVNYELLWQDWLENASDTAKKRAYDAAVEEAQKVGLPLPKQEDFEFKPNTRRAFELAKPIVNVTQDLVDRIGPLEQANIDSSRQARLSSDLARANWKTSDVAKNKGGISQQEFIDAIHNSPAKSVLNEYTPEEVKQKVKSGEMQLFQLGDDGQIFFSLLKGDPAYASDYGIDIPEIGNNEVKLSSVINNEQGAKGIAGPAVVLKALENGATVLDAFAVKNDKYPNGFLPTLYEAFGFQKVGEVPFDPQYYTNTKLKDAVKYWKDSTKGYDPNVHGYPPLVIMKWKGTDAQRQNIIRRYLEGGLDGLLAGRASENVNDFAKKSRSLAGAEVGESALPNESGVRGDQGTGVGSSLTSKPRDVIKGIANLTDNELKNLGLTVADREAAQQFSQPSEPAIDRVNMAHKDVLKRVPQLTEAAQKLAEGNLSPEDYQDLVNKYKPIQPYQTAPEPASKQKIIDALKKTNREKPNTPNKSEYFGVPSKTLKEGDPVGIRLDIPSYKDANTWVVTVHKAQTGKKVYAGAGPRIGYEPVARATDVQFMVHPQGALKIAQGSEKTTLATMEGKWKPTTEKQAHVEAKDYLNDPEWSQVGMDPERHSYFYDRKTGNPVTHADEILQIGPLVLAKNARNLSKAGEFKYKKGGAVHITKNIDSMWMDIQNQKFKGN
jgi:hypothetical protein